MEQKHLNRCVKTSPSETRKTSVIAAQHRTADIAHIDYQYGD